MLQCPSQKPPVVTWPATVAWDLHWTAVVTHLWRGPLFCNLHVSVYETIENRCHVIIISFIRTFSLNILIQFRTTPNKRYEHSFNSFSLTIVSRSLLHFIKLTTRACRNNYFSVGVLLSVKVNCRKKKHFLLGIHHVWLERLVVISKIYLQNLKNIVSLC